MWRKILYLVFLILLIVIPVSVFLVGPEREYRELWDGEVEVADHRFLPIDKNESIDKSTFWAVSSRLTALLAKGVPEINDSYVHHSLDWQNGTAYVVLEDTNEEVARFILDQFSPHVHERIRFLESSAPRSQIGEWRETLMEICWGRLRERGVNWTSMGTYYDGRILLGVEEITPETIHIIEEAVKGRVPPGIIVIEETGPIEVYDQSAESIESRVEWLVDRFNLSDMGYEVTLKSANLSEALIYFRVRGGRIPFMTISHVRDQENWSGEQWARHRTPSPSRSVEIVDFRIKVGLSDQLKILKIINPLVRNLGSGTAYVGKVKFVVSNTTHTFGREYDTLSKNPMDSLIRQGESKWVSEVSLLPAMMQDTTGKWLRLDYDALGVQTYTITITIYDGAGTVLAESSFVHTFQR